MRRCKEWIRLGIVAVIISGFLGACATRPSKWESRIGNYTFDMSVAELGPSHRQALLSDGKRVAEWTTSSGFYADPFVTPGVGSYTPYSTRVPGGVLQLTFANNGELLAWKKLRR
jgi:hypothetical protein